MNERIKQALDSAIRFMLMLAGMATFIIQMYGFNEILVEKTTAVLSEEGREIILRAVLTISIYVALLLAGRKALHLLNK